MNTLPINIINKIMLYNSHPVADIFKDSKFISDNHKIWNESKRWSNMCKLLMLQGGIDYPTYWNNKLSPGLHRDFESIYNADIHLKFYNMALRDYCSDYETSSDSDYEE